MGSLNIELRCNVTGIGFSLVDVRRLNSTYCY